MLLPTGSGKARRPSTVGAAASAAGLGLSSEAIPWPMNTADNRGLAILRNNMTAGLPDRSADKPSGAEVPLEAQLAAARRYGGTCAGVDHRRRAKRLLRGWPGAGSRRRRPGPRHQ